MAKKKFLNIYYIFLLVVVFAIFLGLFSNSYAITENELYEVLEDSVEMLNTKENRSYSFDRNNYVYTGVKNWNFPFNSFLNIINQFEYVVTYFTNYGSSSNPNYAISINVFNYNSNSIDLGNNTNISGEYYNMTYYINDNSLYIGGTSTKNGSFIIHKSSFTLIHNFDYKYNNVLYPSNISFIPPNSIVLTAIKSGSKFSFTDKTQLKVDLVGYDISDFTFYVQKYDNNEWDNFTDFNDYLRVADYENPYYIFWRNLNYFPVGTYRYMAQYNGENSFSTVSNSFQITSSYIENEGTATGTIDSNTGDVNIDVSVDTGQTVDSIKDYLGEEAQTTENEFKNNFPEVEIDDPSEDFFSWVFDNIENIFVSTSEQEFSFSLYTNTTYTINSSMVYVPNGVVKTLIGLFCDFGICYWIIRDVRKVINKIKEGSIEAIADEDITANMV